MGPLYTNYLKKKKLQWGGDDWTNPNDGPGMMDDTGSNQGNYMDSNKEFDKEKKKANMSNVGAVSYTHLTLPTM
jgi:hypothetical protein